MSEKWKAAFDQIHAENELKEHTREYLSRKVYRRRERRFPAVRGFAAAAVCLAVIFFAGGSWLFFTPTAFISVDINPSLELGINRFDRIVSVEGYNDDGRELAASLNIKYMNYADGVAQILEDQNIEDYLSQDALLSLTVAGENAEQYDEILADMESCASAHANVSCHSGDVEEMHEAHAEGVSLGKYRAFLRLQELDPSVTLDDIRDLTMREIQDLIDEYSAPAEESGSVGTSTGSQYEPESGHHGSDYGNSHENRHNRSRHEHE